MIYARLKNYCGVGKGKKRPKIMTNIKEIYQATVFLREGSCSKTHDLRLFTETTF